MTEKLRFILNGEERAVRLTDPTRTLLQLLRYDLRLTGTKEGCAEGDCGACTVVLGRIEDGGLVYRPVNACILFAPEIDGCEVITVEGLSGTDGALHPLQQAMVDTNASQCGFCTPGFVMALYAHGVNGRSCDRAALKDAIAGNLCRCTGYGPILEAGERMTTFAPALRRDGAARAAQLAGLARKNPLDLSGECPLTGAPMRYRMPETVEALAAILEESPETTLVAGATDVGLWVTKQHRRLADIVSLSRIDALRRVEETDEAVVFGATVPLAEVMARVAPHYPDFGELLRRFGAVQVRESGTIGGNVANGSPIGDSMPALIALGASVRLRIGRDRREIPLEDLYIDYGKQARAPGEFVEAVRLPKPRPGLVFKAYKISKRFDQDISALCAAFALEIEDGRVGHARIAFGGMAPIPARASATEAALAGRPWTEQTLAEAMAALGEDFAPISDMRGSAEYRLKVARNLLRKAWLETAGEAGPIRLAGREAVHA